MPIEFLTPKVVSYSPMICKLVSFWSFSSKSFHWFHINFCFTCSLEVLLEGCMIWASDVGGHFGLRNKKYSSLLSHNAQSLMWYRRLALLFFGVIHEISRSNGLNSRWFESNLSKITRPVAAIKSLRFALFFNENVWILIKISLKCVPNLQYSCIGSMTSDDLYAS